jgi:hypothetical protein
MSNSIYNKQSHYVYRISHILENKHYYGSRSCKCKPQDDLGVKYFSSSHDKEFILEQKEYPENFKYKIIRICETRKEALEYEILLHEKFNVGVNENFYNRAKQTSTGWNREGIITSEETSKKLSKIRKGSVHSEETRKKMSEAQKGEKNPNYGKHRSKETRKKISESLNGKKNHFYGKNHSKETKKKMSESKKCKKTL